MSTELTEAKKKDEQASNSDKIHKHGKVNTGLFCPARIFVKEDLPKKSVNVEYIFTQNHKVSITKKIPAHSSDNKKSY